MKPLPAPLTGIRAQIWMVQARYRLWKRKHFVRPALSNAAKQGWETRRAAR